jgi:hypothetical protein
VTDEPIKDTGYSYRDPIPYCEECGSWHMKTQMCRALPPVEYRHVEAPESLRRIATGDPGGNILRSKIAAISRGEDRKPALQPVTVLRPAGQSYSYYTRVTRVWEHKERDHAGGTGADALFTERNLGWFLAMEGSYEALPLGPTKPTLEVGDKILVTIEKVPG